MTISKEARAHLKTGGRVRFVEGVEVLLPPSPPAPDLSHLLLNPFTSPKMAAYWPDEAQRLATENRELRATLRQRNCAIGCYQILSIVAVLGCILLAMGV